MTTRIVQIPFKTGTTSQNDQYLGGAGEITIDRTKRSIRVHDGIKRGGEEILRRTDIAEAVQATSDANTLLHDAQQAASTINAVVKTATDAATTATGARDIAVGARDVATGARDTATGARDTTLGYRDTAKGYQDNAKTYQDNAYTYKGNASDSAAAALAAQNLALKYASSLALVDGTYYGALKYAQDALSYRDTAKGYQDNAKTYQDNAYTYKGNASDSAAAALASQNLALKYASSLALVDGTYYGALKYAQDALSYRDTAKGYQDNAKTYQDNAYTYKGNASDSAAAALGSQNLAAKWATYMAGEVNGVGSGYSAAYYAAQAAQSAANASAGQVPADWNQADPAQKDYIKNKPALKAVATSGSYTDLTNKPILPSQYTDAMARAAISVSGNALSYNNATGVLSFTMPALATVATSGSYNDLANKPYLYSAAYVQSPRDFVNGTLVLTDLNHTDGANPFLMHITGNAYTGGAPFDIRVQGYPWSGSLINQGGLSNGSTITGLVVFANAAGKLCFWWPRQSYWQGFSIHVSQVQDDTVSVNHVTAISDSAMPTGAAATKVVAISLIQSLHSSNYNTFSPKLDGTGASGTWNINVLGKSGSVQVRDSSVGSTINRKAGNVSPDSVANAVQYDFVDANSANLPANFAGLRTFSPYNGTTASTGGPSHQTAFGNSGNDGAGQPLINHRSGIDKTWNAWWSVMMSGGSGVPTQDLNTKVVAGNYRLETGLTNGPGANGYGNLLVMRAAGYDTIHQIYGDYANGSLWTRGGNPSDTGGGGSWQPWRQLLDALNYSNYTVTKTGAGAVGTWNININGGGYSLIGSDTRNATDTPANKLTGTPRLTLDFKMATSVANPPIAANASGATHIMTIAGWGDNTGGYPSQFSFGDGLAVRQGISDTAWGPWRNLYHTGNLTLVSSGDGRSIDYSNKDMNVLKTVGFYRGTTMGSAPGAGWWYITVEVHDGSWVKQTATAYGGAGGGNSVPTGTTYIRTYRDGTTWSAWGQVAIGLDGGATGMKRAWISQMVETRAQYAASNKNASNQITLDLANYGYIQLLMDATPLTLLFGAPGTGTDLFGFTLEVNNTIANASLILPACKWDSANPPVRTTGSGTTDWYYFWTRDNGATWNASMSSKDSR